MANERTFAIVQGTPSKSGTVQFRVAWRADTWQPRVDVCQTETGLEVQIEVAGIEQENLNLQFEPGQLIVEGRRERACSSEAARCLQMEIEYGAFRRALPLPPEADGEAIQAKYEAGLLSISIPFKRPQTSQPLRVDIS